MHESPVEEPQKPAQERKCRRVEPNQAPRMPRRKREPRHVVVLLQILRPREKHELRPQFAVASDFAETWTVSVSVRTDPASMTPRRRGLERRLRGAQWTAGVGTDAVANVDAERHSPALLMVRRDPFHNVVRRIVRLSTVPRKSLTRKDFQEMARRTRRHSFPPATGLLLPSSTRTLPMHLPPLSLLGNTNFSIAPRVPTGTCSQKAPREQRLSTTCSIREMRLLQKAPALKRQDAAPGLQREAARCC